MRYALTAVAGLIALVGLVAAVGWMLPVGHRASVARTYHASPAALYTLITDVAAYPTWRSEVRGVETLPEEDGHRRWVEATKNGAPITYVAEQSVPDRLLVSRIANTDLPFGGKWTYELTPAGPDRTTLRITEDGEVYNPIFRFVSRYVMGHESTMKQYHAAVGRRFGVE